LGGKTLKNGGGALWVPGSSEGVQSYWGGCQRKPACWRCVKEDGGGGGGGGGWGGGGGELSEIERNAATEQMMGGTVTTIINDYRHVD